MGACRPDKMHLDLDLRNITFESFLFILVQKQHAQFRFGFGWGGGILGCAGLAFDIFPSVSLIKILGFVSG